MVFFVGWLMVIIIIIYGVFEVRQVKQVNTASKELSSVLDSYSLCGRGYYPKEAKRFKGTMDVISLATTKGEDAQFVVEGRNSVLYLKNKQYARVVKMGYHHSDNCVDYYTTSPLDLMPKGTSFLSVTWEEETPTITLNTMTTDYNYKYMELI